MDWVTFRSAIRDAVEDAWPEVTASSGGFIWSGPAIERVSLEDLTEDEEDATPTAIVQMSAPRVATELVGIANHVWEVDLLVHYLRRRDNTATDWEEFLEGRLVTLQSQLLHTPLMVGQVIDVTSLDVSEMNPLMALLLDKNKPFVAGSLGVLCEVGDSPT